MDTTNTDVLKPRQVLLEACTLLALSRSPIMSFDLRPAVRAINLYESVLNSTISGTVELDDITGIAEMCPLIGEEGLLLRFHRGSDQVYQGAFRVVKMTNREFLGEEYQRLTLHFVSNELLTSLSDRICRAFVNKTASQAVSEILTKDIKTPKPLHIDDTLQPLTVTIPNYTAFDTIQFFAQRAVTASTPPQANYFFWETLDGFRFQSLSTMMPATPVATIQMQPGNLFNAYANNVITPERMYVKEAFDVIRDIDEGLFASRTIAVDLLRQDYQIFDSTYRDDFNRRAHLDPFPAYSRSHTETATPAARIAVVSATNNLAANTRSILALDPTMRRGFWPDTVALRTTQMNEMRRHTTMTESPGHVAVRAGSTVIVKVPSMRHLAIDGVTLQDVAPVHYDKYYSGKHFVLSCRHQIINTDGKFEYKQSLELVKDSLASSLT